MANIRDVAKEAKVSVATVSRVINKLPHTSETAMKAVHEAMERLNYRPNANARALANKTSSSIGVLVADVSNPFYGAMVQAIDEIAREHKKHILITHGYHNETYEREAIELLINNQCEHLVIHSKGLSDQELIEFSKQIPGLIIINRYIPEIAERCVALDNIRGSSLALSHLIRFGHKRIGYLASSHNIDDSVDRKLGYRSELEKNQLPYSEALVVSGEPNEIGGADAMRNLLAKNEPFTAIATYNDLMAAGAISVLKENNLRVPEDVSVIGFDDAMIASYLQPTLTTVRYPVQIMASQAAKLSIQLVEKSPHEHKGNLYLPTLVSRNSITSPTNNL
ncbi:substrate-binding domain-containing protein [Vibrio splendidus]|uniref:substrate-binding domain-containing protein n=1 Tax=Vibrio splendidus TaxID=29497 RepID=UPI000C819B96|nr:substrate-binding domain-containing protein [Vibrio splendidus]PMK39957.1 DNA-binding transcriptional regulator GalS [Vibrio splendidus]